MKHIKSPQVRIIGGHWRGSKLQVPDVEGLRPTPDRVRETLFNWIALNCPGANVLDCFAGSGALGFEALSRQARQVTMIETNQVAWNNLVIQAKRLKSKWVDIRQVDLRQFDIRQGDALQLIPQLSLKYDLIFIDPPYAQGFLKQTVIDALLQGGLLSPAAKFYIEWPKGERFELPSNQFNWLKQKKAGQINYAMVEWSGSR